jgi:hypothetical protein
MRFKRRKSECMLSIAVIKWCLNGPNGHNAVGEQF